MPAYNAQLARFAALDAQVLGISTDSIYSHMAWQRHEIGTLGYPLASDFHPHGGVAKKYGVFRDSDPIPGVSDRAVFVVDKQGKVAFAKTYDLGELPDNEEVFVVLERLKLAETLK